MDIFGNLKKALIDALQVQAGKVGTDFLSDLSFTLNGSIEFKVTDDNTGKVIMDLTLPITSSGKFQK